MTRTQVRKQFTPIVSTLALFVVWEAACWAFQIPTFILPRPTEALAALIENWPGIWPNALHTLITTLIGFGAAVAVGMMLGIAVGTSALVYDAINPLLIGFNAIPKVALVPILVLWFGIEARRFKGPPIGAEIARRQAEIAVAEKAVGETG